MLARYMLLLCVRLSVRLSYGAVCVILHLVVLTQYRRVTDGQTDGWTDSPGTLFF